LSIYDNVEFEAELPGRVPHRRMFITADLSEHPDSTSLYIVTKDGELHLIHHEQVELRKLLKARGLLWQYPNVPDMRLGLQKYFSDRVVLWSDVAAYEAEFANGVLRSVTKAEE
jgi:hypothetical protein